MSIGVSQLVLQLVHLRIILLINCLFLIFVMLDYLRLLRLMLQLVSLMGGMLLLWLLWRWIVSIMVLFNSFLAFPPCDFSLQLFHLFYPRFLNLIYVHNQQWLLNPLNLRDLLRNTRDQRLQVWLLNWLMV
jgi:hypothetical protein